ncbi:acyl-homoserine-lactone synthase [Algicella marina]|uniref:Acyl-homoserine-lactone synthase n=1 Tax=Algicella marina TaxID=2683284 RepID=A0A6P1T3B2_9RHOB|nr:acyl-homoserine-lactone synthase [Algicella marina]QHQ36251.1 autoinducer synthase [Algicella marina]
MIRFIYADQLATVPLLAETMFRDRAAQFQERLKWDVSVDANGFERDEYDAVNPMYIMWEGSDGRHKGSMRILPTLGRTMVNEHFLHLTGGVTIQSPLIWECTRFCISPDAHDDGKRIAGGVMLAGHELGLRFGLLSSIGVFDARMRRIYRSIGWEPEVIGEAGEGRARICAGLWPFSEEIRARIAASAGLDEDLGRTWFDASFPSRVPETKAAA